MSKASAKDREYFERIARQNRQLPEEQAPGSLVEMFGRLERIRERLGALAEPGIEGDAEGDLQEHLAFLARVKRRSEAEHA